MKTLVAGFGNIFYGDDAFGSSVAASIPEHTLPAGSRVADFGIRGLHLAFEMLDDYELVVLADITKRGGEPGTIYVIEPGDLVSEHPDAHAMELHNALAFYGRLASGLQTPVRPALLIVGCEPASLDEGIGMSDVVAAAVPRAVELIYSLLRRNGVEVGIS